MSLFLIELLRNFPEIEFNARNMGQHLKGKTDLRGHVTYQLSPMGQNPTAHFLSKQWKDIARGLRNQGPILGLTFGILYFRRAHAHYLNSLPEEGEH
ncbi:hypothetical protein PROFUN_02244 [Planoprotostelium fungivorum]|uniref:Cytochrome b-c1 complex subunit 8 n=1 Tax=Planoprotostelium fungivorum TaxID=1890364 RepID=A0A2P6NYD1_9EUKA|nr:hypothetical protein PROFUN_02244 [Planoprotostelium fungivorum]